jgi:hypothetical protein
MLNENPGITIMKAVIAKATELEKNLPANPKQLIDTAVIGMTPFAGEIRLIKDDNHIKLAKIENGRVKIAHLLDDDILVGVIGMSNEAWNKVLNRLPDFREYIDNSEPIVGELRKMKKLGEKYGKEYESERDRIAAAKTQRDADAESIKAKLKTLEEALTQKMPFSVIYPIERTEANRGLYLVKTADNKINLHHVLGGGWETESHYANADSDLIVKLTDAKLNGFLIAINEELQKRLSK